MRSVKWEVYERRSLLPVHGIIFCTTASSRGGEIVLAEEHRLCSAEGCSEATTPLPADQVNDPDHLINLADMHLEDANSKVSASELYQGIMKHFGDGATADAKVAIARGILDYANTF